MDEKIYIIIGKEVFGNNSFISKVYKNKKKAEYHCKLLNELEGTDPDYFYYLDEQTFNDDNFSLNTKVVPYFSYTIHLDQGIEYDTYNDDEPQLRIYDTDLVIEENTDANFITCYHIESYKKAKDYAIKYYQEHFEE